MLYLVPTPIGNLQDLSFRSLKLLEEANIILCEDTRVTKRLLHLLKEKFNISPTTKQFISLHSHNEKEILTKLSPDIFQDTVLYVSDAGMPTVSDPGCELINYCNKYNIKYDVLPGANAMLLAYASSGFCDSKFLFFGFLPHKGSHREEALKEALYCGYVTILYESPYRIEKLIEQIVAYEPNREIFLIKEATKLHQTSFKGKAVELQTILKEQNLKGEWVVVIDGKKREVGAITIKDILELNIPKKQAAKLISKISGKSPKECYKELI